MSFYGDDFYGSEFFGYQHQEEYIGVSVFFGGEFFDGGFFRELSEEYAGAVGGKGDDAAPKTIFKPTGLPPYRKTVEQRVQETREIHREVARKVLTLPEAPKAIKEMSLTEIEAEIGERLRAQLREDEEIVALLLAATVAG